MTPRLVIRGTLGILLASFSIILASVGIYHLARTGSCASGGPYVSARPCPPGTGGHVLGLIAGIFVLAPLSVLLYGTRGRGIKGLPGVGALIGLLWTFLWLAMGTASWVATHGPAKDPTSGSGGTSVAITFWGIGGLSLLFVAAGIVGARRTGSIVARARAAASPSPTAPVRFVPPSTPAVRPPSVADMAATLSAVRDKVSGSGDVASRLKELESLKASGAVTAEEYAAKRKEILGDI